MGYQYRSVSGGEVHLPPLGSGLRLQPTNPSSVTQRSSSATDASSGAPGDCGSWQTPMNVSGNSPTTRAMRSLHARAHSRADPLVALVVGHGGRPRREDRHVGAALAEQPELVLLDRLADLVVGDGRVVRRRAALPERGELAGPPVGVRAGGGRVVPVAVDDHSGFPGERGLRAADVVDDRGQIGPGEGIGVAGRPELALRRRERHQGLDAGLLDGGRGLGHLLGAPPAVQQRAGDEVRRHGLPVGRREDVRQRVEHLLLHAVVARREQRLGQQGLEPLGDDRAAELARGGAADLLRVHGEVGQAPRGGGRRELRPRAGRRAGTASRGGGRRWATSARPPRSARPPAPRRARPAACGRASWSSGRRTRPRGPGPAPRRRRPDGSSPRSRRSRRGRRRGPPCPRIRPWRPGGRRRRAWPGCPDRRTRCPRRPGRYGPRPRGPPRTPSPPRRGR